MLSPYVWEVPVAQIMLNTATDVLIPSETLRKLTATIVEGTLIVIQYKNPIENVDRATMIKAVLALTTGAKLRSHPREERVGSEDLL